MDLTVLPLFAVRYTILMGIRGTAVAEQVVTVRARDEEQACAAALAYAYNHDPQVVSRTDARARIVDVDALDLAG